MNIVDRLESDPNPVAEATYYAQSVHEELVEVVDGWGRGEMRGMHTVTIEELCGDDINPLTEDVLEEWA